MDLVQTAHVALLAPQAYPRRRTTSQVSFTSCDAHHVRAPQDRAGRGPPGCPPAGPPTARPVIRPRKLLRETPTTTGRPSAASASQPGQQREVVLQRLAEADARDPPPAPPAPGRARPRPRSRAAQVVAHLRHDVVVPRVRPASSAARPACASGSRPRPIARATPAMPGSAARAETSLMMSRARLERRAPPPRPCAYPPKAADAAPRAQGLDHRDHPAQFLVRGHRRRAGPRGFAADVQDVRALLLHAPGRGPPRAPDRGTGRRRRRSPGVTLRMPMTSVRGRASSDSAGLAAAPDGVCGHRLMRRVPRAAGPARRAGAPQRAGAYAGAWPAGRRRRPPSASRPRARSASDRMRPCLTISSTSRPSSVSRSSSSCATRVQLVAVLAIRMSSAWSWASRRMRLTSVVDLPRGLLAELLVRDTSRPRNSSSSRWPKVCGPSVSLMPQSQTIMRAIRAWPA